MTDIVTSYVKILRTKLMINLQNVIDSYRINNPTTCKVVKEAPYLPVTTLKETSTLLTDIAQFTRDVE